MTTQVSTNCIVVALSLVPAIAIGFYSFHLHRGLIRLRRNLVKGEAQRRTDHAAIMQVMETGRRSAPKRA